MENEETLKIIKILVMAGGILYAGWSMLKKKTGTNEAPRTLRERGENFPFPIPEKSAGEMSEGQMIDEGAIDEDRVWTADKEEGGAMATGTASIVAEEAAGDNSDGREEIVEPQVVTDLRTMIISSELLKPKYEEF